MSDLAGTTMNGWPISPMPLGVSEASPFAEWLLEDHPAQLAVDIVDEF
ncbi:MAG: hypothetical protein ABSA65_10925 [Acidimicrobiales bacterium]